MKRFIYGAAAGFVMLAAPCAMSQEKKPEPAATASASPAVKVKLIEAGAEPRKELRYAPKAGTSEKLTLRMTMSSESEMGGQKLMSVAMPMMVMDMDVKVDEVRANGDIAWSLVMTKADVEAGGSDNPAVVTAMQTALKGMVGMTGTAVVSNRGETSAVELKLPPTADPSSAQMIESLKMLMRQVATPLPVEAVGKGAKWESTTTVKSSGITFDQIATLTLKEVSESDFEAGISVVQKATRQSLELPGMPPGAVVELMGMKSDGSGNVKASMTSIVPTESSLNVATDQELKASESAQAPAQTMKQHVKVETSMKRGGAESPAAVNAPKETPATMPKEAPADAPKK